MGVKSTNDGSDTGVMRAVLVVSGMGVGSEPVTVGYVPVQYETVVVILFVGMANVYPVFP